MLPCITPGSSVEAPSQPSPAPLNNHRKVAKFILLYSSVVFTGTKQETKDNELVLPEIPRATTFVFRKLYELYILIQNANTQFKSMGHGSTCTPHSKHVSAEISLSIKLIRDIQTIFIEVNDIYVHFNSTGVG